MRTRRDHARFLNLIEVSAFLHQHQRGARRRGAIVAAWPTTRPPTASPREVLTDTLSDLKKPLREAYDAHPGPFPQGRRLGLAPRDPRGAGSARLDRARLAHRAGGARVPRGRSRARAAGKAAATALTGRGPQPDLILGLLDARRARAAPGAA